MRGIQAVLILALVAGTMATPHPRPRRAAVFVTAVDAPSAPQAVFPLGLPRLYCWVRNNTVLPRTRSLTFIWEKERPHRLIDRFARPRAPDIYTGAYETDAARTPGRYRCAVAVGGRVVGSARYTVTPTARAATRAGGSGGAQPATTSPRGALAIGDSVMLDAAADLESHGITVDAAVSRQFDAGIAILQAMSGRLPGEVVVGLGTNGPISQALFDEMMGVLPGVRRVVFVTVKVPRWWEGEVNSVLQAGVARWPNARLADWHAIAWDHPDWFADDGFHLSPEGAAAYAHVVVDALQ